MGHPLDSLDLEDPIRDYRSEFLFPKTKSHEDFIYLAGNSLGLQPKKAKEYVNQELEDWAKLGVEGHLHARHAWLPYHEFLTPATARLVGAQENEVVYIDRLNGLRVWHVCAHNFYKSPCRSNKNAR